MKAVAIPLMMEIEEERHGMLMPSDLDKLNSVIHQLLLGSSPRVRAVGERFLSDLRAAAIEDAREEGRLMLDSDANRSAKSGE